MPPRLPPVIPAAEGRNPSTIVKSDGKMKPNMIRRALLPRMHSAWEDLMGNDNCVDLEPDVWYTIADLEWLDVDLDNVIWSGVYEQQSGADHIKLNSYYMDQHSLCAQKNVTMHELGHAHGLAHYTTTANVVMRAVNASPYVCVLGTHDIADYTYKWGTP